MVPEYYKTLADSLSGSCSTTSDFFQIVARRKGLDLVLRGLDSAIISSYFLGNFLEPEESLLEQVRALPGAPSVNLLALGEEESLAVVCMYDDAHPPQLPAPDALLDWLDRVIDLILPQVLVESPLCSDCGTDDGTRVYAESQMVLRLCASCQERKLKLLTRLDQLSQPESNKPQLEFSEDLDGQAMQERAERLRRRRDENPRRFWLELLALVVLGQLALAGGVLSLGVLVFLLVALVVMSLVHGHLVVLLYAKPLLSLGAKLLVPLGLALAGLGKSLVGLFRKDAGAELPKVHLERHQAPALFARLDRVSQELSAPRIDRVYLVEDFNAAANEVRQGLRYRRNLLLGLPILEGFSEHELDTIAAHELAHFMNLDTRSMWVYRTANSWHDLGARLAHTSGLNLLAHFARWFLPHFLLRANVIARAQEFSADLKARELSGGGGNELLKFNVYGALYVEKLAETLLRWSRMGEIASYDPIRETLAAVLAAPPARWQEAIEDALVQPTHPLDSHPSLAERLANLGVPLDRPVDMSLRGDCRHLIPDYGRLREQVLSEGDEVLRLKGELFAHSLPGRRAMLERVLALQLAPERETLRDEILTHLYKSLGRWREAMECSRRAWERERASWGQDPPTPSRSERAFVELCLDFDQPEQGWECLEARCQRGEGKDEVELGTLEVAWQVCRRGRDLEMQLELTLRILAHKDLHERGRTIYQGYLDLLMQKPSPLSPGAERS